MNAPKSRSAHEPSDIGEYIGKTIECMVLKIDEARRNIVVSRRSLIESQRAEKKAELESLRLAAKAVAGGHVKVAGERAKAGHKVRPGEMLEIVRDRERFVVRVERLPGRRGPAAEARGCYTEDPAASAERESRRRELLRDRMTMPRTAGRPDKHTRRLLRKRNRGDP